MKNAQEARKEIELQRHAYRWKQIYHSYYLLKFYMDHCIQPFHKQLGKLIEQQIINTAKERRPLRPFSLKVEYRPFSENIISDTKQKKELFQHLLLSGVLQYDEVEPKRNRFTGERFYDTETIYRNHILFAPLLRFLSSNGYHVTDFNGKRYLQEDKPDQIHDYNMTFTITL